MKLTVMATAISVLLLSLATLLPTDRRDLNAIAGECLAVEASASLDGNPEGLTGKNCLHQTDCFNLTTVGPKTVGHEGVSVTVGAWIPHPTAPSPTCLL